MNGYQLLTAVGDFLLCKRSDAEDRDEWEQQDGMTDSLEFRATVTLCEVWHYDSN